MPRPNDTPDVKASKGLAYILRHGAEKEGLNMRSDGYIKLRDVLARPKMRDVDTDMVLRLVAENAKQRFELFYGIDPSPPKPKVKKGQGKGKGKGKAQPPIAPSSAAEASISETGDNQATETDKQVKETINEGEIDAAAVEDLSKDMKVKTVISTELPLIALPPPSEETPKEGSTSTQGEWFIRATQGHSIELESVAHLSVVNDDEEGRARAGLCVHGTRWELWDTLKSTGLSRMARTHIHLAPVLADGPIVPRPNSTLRIYLDIPKLLDAGIPLYTSSNGVVLTPGNDHGVVEKEYWRLAEKKVDGRWIEVWRDGKEIEGVL